MKCDHADFLVRKGHALDEYYCECAACGHRWPTTDDEKAAIVSQLFGAPPREGEAAFWFPPFRND